MNNSNLKEKESTYNRQERLAKLTEKITNIQVESILNYRIWKYKMFLRQNF